LISKSFNSNTLSTQSQKHWDSSDASRNLIVHCQETATGIWSMKDNGILDTDPGFSDAARNRTVLGGDAPLWQQAKGLEPIPFHEIGLYTDELRPTLPE